MSIAKVKLRVTFKTWTDKRNAPQKNVDWYSRFKKKKVKPKQ